MTNLTSIIGREAVSRTSAENLGEIKDAVVDIATRKVIAWQVGKGRKASVVEQGHVVGIGDAAVMVDDDASVREPQDDVEAQTLKGHRSLLKSLVLNDSGDSLGEVTDADIDTASAAIVAVQVGDQRIEAARLLGFGTYSLVVRT